MDLDTSTQQPPLKWSGAFNIHANDGHTSHTLAGDKIILPQSALEQLLAAAAQHGQLTSMPAYSHTNFFSSAPIAAFGQDSSQQLPNPLMFRLVNAKTNVEVFAGIREFSAPDDTIYISSYLREALGLDAKTSKDDGAISHTIQDSQIVVHAAHLPKGTYARLRPLEAGYNPDDWKPLLERQLRNNFTSLTKDTMIVVNGVHGETFRLLVDKVIPEGGGVCVVDTDLEVDIEALNEEQARETLRQLATSNKTGGPGPKSGITSAGGELDIWKSVDGQVSAGDYVDYVLPSWNRSQPLEISVTGFSEDDPIDLFVSPRSTRQRALPRDTEHVFSDFGQSHPLRRVVTISPSNVELENADSILIAVHGSTDANVKTTVTFAIRAKAVVGSQEDVEPATNGASSSDHGPDEQQCKNCHQWIPKQTMILHENFCRRNNIVCPQCQQVFKKASEEWHSHWHCEHDDAHGNSIQSREKHTRVFHMDRQCPSCPFTTNSLPDLARHRTSICPGKIILCQFCHLEVPQEGDPFNISPEVALSGLTAHELADGGRTTECHLCDKIIRLRDMETHMKHHELDKVGRTKPPICRNANCGRTMYGVGSRGNVHTLPVSSATSQANDLDLCSICFGPLYVSMHDPEGKALRRRIERRYLGQLMKGCGKTHCRNEWCKTGRETASLDALGSSASAALAAVKPLMAALPNRQEPMFFCVDEASQTRKRLAEMIAAEKVWSLEWCVAAAEAEKGSVDKMRDWLQSWAPRGD